MKRSLISQAKDRLLNPLTRAMASVEDMVAGGEGEEEQRLERFIGLFVHVMRADGDVGELELSAAERFLRDHQGEDAVKKLRELAQAETLPPLDDLCAGLRDRPGGEKEALLEALFAAAFADNRYGAAERQTLRGIARELGLGSRAFERLEEAALDAHNDRMRLVRSGAGLAAAAAVILIFILTATFLKAVLFGLILAYFFQPLQQRLAASFLKKGVLFRLCQLAALPAMPFRWVIRRVKSAFGRDRPEPKPSAEETEAARVRDALNRSCHATVLMVCLAGLLAMGGLIVLTLSYKPPAMPESDAVRTKAAALVAKARDWPVLGGAARELHQMLADPQAIQNLQKRLVTKARENLQTESSTVLGSAWKALGAFFSLLGFLGNLFLNLLLTVFFFSFFLGKMAKFHQKSGHELKEGDYLVQSLFQSSWLPTTSQETLASAAEIVNEVFAKLKTWVRGYLWIIIVETIFYITVFLFMGIPYAGLLGAVAGLTVLLPFLGPLISMALTIGACLVAGHGDMTLYLSIVGVYFVMNSIIEQLFLYPALVGEALGLNVLETLIVVLLGGLFAGLAGVIFAVPAASVLKFLIPRVYQSLFQTPELELPTEVAAG